MKQALDDASALLFLGIRFGLASLILLAVFRGVRLRRAANPWQEVRGGLLAGLFLFGGYYFQTVGLKYTTPSSSAFLTGLYVVLVPLLAALLYRRNPQVSEWIGVCIATVGMVLLTLPGFRLSLNRGDVLTLACAVAFALHLLAVERQSRRGAFQSLAILQVATAAALSLATFSWTETPYLAWTPRLLVALGVTSIFGTALAFTAMSWAQQHTTATRAAVIFALEPVVAWLTSFLAAGETFSAQASMGAVLILGGILVVELKPIR